MSDKIEIEKIEHRTRDGKQYIVINQSAWYPADKYTDETASEDYIKTHSNNGWNFIPQFTKEN